jgi:hypothetical protein
VGVVVDEVLRGQHHLEVDVLRRVGRETKGHQRAEEAAFTEAGEGGRERRGRAHGLEASSEVLQRPWVSSSRRPRAAGTAPTRCLI